MRSIAVLAGMSVAAVVMPAASAATPHDPVKSMTGSIKVHVIDPSNKPVPNQKFCATTKKADSAKADPQNQVLGICDTTNKQGNAMLKKVPLGQHFVTLLTSSGQAVRSKKVTVQKRTVTSNWTLG